MSKDGLKTYHWILLWLILLVSALFYRPPLPIDETRYLSVAWEMWQSHQFLVPHSNGIPYSHKPPLLFWLIQAGWWLFGVNEWSARATAPIFGLFTILLTLHLARALWPPQKELHNSIPYLLLGTCFWAIYSTLTMFDMLITCFALVAWLTLWIGQEKSRYACWILYAAATGLGILAKGPVIFVYILPAALLAPWWMDKEQVGSWTVWYGGFMAAIAAGVLIALTWAIPATKAGGSQYEQAILFGQTAGRVVHSFAHQRPFYWYFLMLPFLLFPWSFCLLRWSWVKRLQLTSPVRFCISIIVPGFFLLSAISGKQIHYLLPLLPPLLLLLAQIFFAENRSYPVPHWLLPMLLLFFSLGLFIIPTLPLQGGDSEMLQYLPHWLGAGPLVAAFFSQRKTIDNKQLIKKTSILTIGLLLFFHLAMASSLQRLFDIRSIGEKIRDVQATDKQVAVYPARLADQFQFAGKLVTPLVAQQTLEETVLWSQHHPEHSVLLFLDKKKYPFFAGKGMIQTSTNGWFIFHATEGIWANYLRSKKE